MAINAPMIVTGTVVAGTKVARKFCKNNKITINTKILLQIGFYTLRRPMLLQK